MTTLAFGQLPPGVKTWQDLYQAESEDDAPAGKKWFRVRGKVIIEHYIDRTIEMDAAASEDDILNEAIDAAGIDRYSCDDVDDIGLDVEEVEDPDTNKRIVRVR